MSLMPMGLSGFPFLPGAEPGVVSLLVGGMVYEGFTDVEIRMSVRRTSGEFTLHVSDEHSDGADGPSTPLAWPIKPQDPCQIFYGGHLIMSGVVDALNPRYSKNQHQLTIQGRHKSRDLVDSTVDDEVKGGELRNQTLPQAARKVTKNFGIPIEVEGQIDEQFDVMRVRPGEKVYQFLDRYARASGAAIFPSRKGGLKIAQIEDGAPAASLMEGVNILEGSAMLRADKRHSKVKVKGQDHGTDNEYGEPVATRKAEATDQAVRSYRPLSLLSESKTSRKNARKRAAWESAVRAGESTRAEIKVVDWMASLGQPWEPGMRVMVVSPLLKVNRVLAIENVNFKQSRKNGTTASLSLVPPEALNPKAKGKGGSNGSASSASQGGSGAAAGSFRAGQEAGMDGAWTNTKPDQDPR